MLGDWIPGVKSAVGRDGACGESRGHRRDDGEDDEDRGVAPEGLGEGSDGARAVASIAGAVRMPPSRP